MDALCWIRRDLRLEDHTALAAATDVADRVAIGFVFDTRILEDLPRDDRRVTFIHRSLSELDGRLRERGSRLLVGVGDPVELVPRWARDLEVDAVFANHDDDPYALKRDASVAERLASDGRGLQSFKDHVVLERQEVMNQSGEPFRVFTPYSRAWRANLTDQDIAERPVRHDRFWSADELGNRDPMPALAEFGFLESDLWLEPGERAGAERLREFAAKMADYGRRRDIPGIEGTSGLSVHLRFGTVSIRDCLRVAAAHPSPGSEKWVTELIWREFYHMILANFPHVVGAAFKPEYDAIEWPGTEEMFDRWRQGSTGYPLVDAAMRCLDATGWMHNRLRMVTASFLVKDLLVDWRRGEAHFAEKLLDFELASNNGGWQWCASTGVDAQPTYRIFNPILQSRKFDPEGDFIRRWIPELRHLSNEAIHWPHDCLVDYPTPIVEHGKQRELALALLGSVRSLGG